MKIISGYIYGEDGKLITKYGDGNTYQKVKLGDLVADKTATKVTFTAKKDSDVEISEDADKYILINENGKVKKSGKAKDVNEEDVHVSNYIVQDED